MKLETAGECARGRVLVTGARGFVGAALCAALSTHRFEVLRAQRGEPVVAAMAVDTLVHLAARVHVMGETSCDALPRYRAANTAATLALAEQAAVAGVRRFVFVSTVKVNGEECEAPYRESDTPRPVDPYAISKWEAEQGLREI